MSSNIPHPSEHREWPSWFYPPDTDPDDASAHGKIFHKADDVPEGWAADFRAHGVNLNREPPPPPVDAGLTRGELKAALVARGIAFKPAAGKAELQKHLDDAIAAEHEDDNLGRLQAALTAHDVEFEPDATEEELQSLLDETEEAERQEAAV